MSSTTQDLRRVKTITSFVRYLAGANIPIFTADNPVTRRFLLENVKNCGSIPHSRQFAPYLEDFFRVDFAKLKKIIEGKPDSISFDETFE